MGSISYFDLEFKCRNPVFTLRYCAYSRKYLQLQKDETELFNSPTVAAIAHCFNIAIYKHKAIFDHLTLTCWREYFGMPKPELLSQCIAHPMPMLQSA